MSDTPIDSGTRCQALGPELTIAQASAVQQRLLPLLLNEPPTDLSLDLSQVQEFDSAGIQLLLATRRSLQAQGQQLRLVQPSSVVRAALSCYGLDAALMPLKPSLETAEESQS